MATMSARYTVIDGEVVAQERGGVRHQLVPDPLGSTVALYDDSGTKTDTFSYWPYGESSGRTGTTPTPFQYVGTLGYYRDASSREYVRARYLDMARGRWITEDPIFGSWLAEGIYSPDETFTNLYIYCDLQPTSIVDESGLQPWDMGFGDPIAPNYTKWCGKTRRCPKDVPTIGINCSDDACARHDRCLDEGNGKWGDFVRCAKPMCLSATRCLLIGCYLDHRGEKGRHPHNCVYIAYQLKKLFCEVAKMPSINPPKRLPRFRRPPRHFSSNGMGDGYINEV